MHLPKRPNKASILVGATGKILLIADGDLVMPCALTSDVSARTARILVSGAMILAGATLVF
jgi:hypothetical protein